MNTITPYTGNIPTIENHLSNHNTNANSIDRSVLAAASSSQVGLDRQAAINNVALNSNSVKLVNALSAREKDLKIINSLIDEGISPEYCKENKTLITYALIYLKYPDDTLVLQKLVKAGCSIEKALNYFIINKEFYPIARLFECLDCRDRLVEAVRMQNIPLIDFLVGHDFLTSTRNGYNILYYAIETGNIECVRAIVEGLFSTDNHSMKCIFEKNKNGESTFEYLLKFGNKEMISNVVCNQKFVTYALSERNLPALRATLTHDSLLCRSTPYCKTEFLSRCISAGKIKLISLFVKAGYCQEIDFSQLRYLESLINSYSKHSVGLLSLKDKNGNTFLHAAISKNNLSLAKALYEAGANGDERNLSNITPLQTAFNCFLDRNPQSKNFDKVEIFILAFSYAKNTDSVENYYSDVKNVVDCNFLLCVIKLNCFKLVKCILEANNYEFNPKVGLMYLEYASQVSDEMFSLFFTQKFLCRFIPFMDKVSFIKLKEMSGREMYKLLLSSSVDDEGNCFIHILFANNKTLNFKRELMCSANINQPNKHGFTPLHVAIQKENVYGCQYLINKGAAISAVREFLKVTDVNQEILKTLRTTKNQNNKTLLDIYNIQDEKDIEFLAPFYSPRCLSELSENNRGNKIYYTYYCALVQVKLGTFWYSKKPDATFRDLLNKNKYMLCEYSESEYMLHGVDNQHVVKKYKFIIEWSRKKTLQQIFEGLFSKIIYDIHHFSVKRHEMTSTPETVLDTFLTAIHSSIKNQLKIIFVNELNLPEAGVDGGGLSRQFINQLLTSLCRPNLFKKLDNGLFIPYMSERNWDKVESLYRKLGYLLTFCLNIKQQNNLHLITGKVFDNSLFIFLKNLDHDLKQKIAERDLKDPQIFQQAWGLFEQINSHTETGSAMCRLLHNCLHAHEDSCEEILLNLYRSIEYEDEIAILNLDSCMEKIKFNFKKLKSVFVKYVRNSILIPSLTPLSYIERGMKCSPYNFYFSYYKFCDLEIEEMSDFLQGKLDKQFIIEKMSFATCFSTNLIEWVKKWILNANEASLKLFLFAATGSTSIGSSSRLNVISGSCINFSTCFMQFKVNPLIKSEEEFIEKLEHALVNVQANNEIAFT